MSKQPKTIFIPQPPNPKDYEASVEKRQEWVDAFLAASPERRLELAGSHLLFRNAFSEVVINTIQYQMDPAAYLETLVASKRDSAASKDPSAVKLVDF